MKIMITLITVLIFSSGAFAQTLEDRIRILEEALKKQEQTIQELKSLQETLKKQEQTIAEQRKLIEELKAEVRQPQPSGTIRGCHGESDCGARADAATGTAVE